jgi:hypothetical protein
LNIRFKRWLGWEWRITVNGVGEGVIVSVREEVDVVRVIEGVSRGAGGEVGSALRLGGTNVGKRIEGISGVGRLPLGVSTRARTLIEMVVLGNVDIVRIIRVDTQLVHSNVRFHGSRRFDYVSSYGRTAHE